MASSEGIDTIEHIDLRISVDDANALLNMGLAKEVAGINSADFVITNFSKWFLILNNRINQLESEVKNMKGELH